MRARQSIVLPLPSSAAVENACGHILALIGRRRVVAAWRKGGGTNLAGLTGHNPGLIGHDPGHDYQILITRTPKENGDTGYHY